MKKLLTIHPHDVGLDDAPAQVYRERHAARAVMFDENNRVYLVHMHTIGVYKLPGGGLDQGEDTETALHRELLEECGTDGDIIANIGEIEEFRDLWGLRQISYCYLVKQRGGHVPTNFMPDEIEDGAELLYANSLDEAINLIESSLPQDYESQFIKLRDVTFLKETKSLL